MATMKHEYAQDTLAPMSCRIPLNRIKRCLSDPGTSVESLVDKSLLRDAIQIVLDSLSTERRMVIALSFGLADNGGVNRGSYTIDEIAVVMNISRERVAAVRATTLLRLRNRKAIKQLLAPFTELPDAG